MSGLERKTIACYGNDFLKEVERNVEDGERVKMCMQCGVCSGSCPFGPHWAHPPQELFMMIRAGKREAVLASDAMWMCTSCYNCVVRCPRQVPVTQIMHGLATYAHRLGLAPALQPTRRFSVQFWDNCTRTGRVNELRLTLGLYFRDGLRQGIRNAWSMRGVGLGLLRARRLNPLELVRAHRCRDRRGIRAMLEKAREIEDRRRRSTHEGIA